MTVIAQSSMALIAAILFTDALRECMHVFRPESDVLFAVGRIIVAILVITVILYYVEQQKPQLSRLTLTRTVAPATRL